LFLCYLNNSCYNANLANKFANILKPNNRHKDKISSNVAVHNFVVPVYPRAKFDPLDFKYLQAVF